MLQEEDNGIDLGIYGLGDVRTHRDYEIYAGINFSNRSLHPHTLEGKNPPVNDDTNWWEITEKEYSFIFDVPKPNMETNFIYIGVEDKNGKVIYRSDMKKHEQNLQVQFKSFTEPYKWVYWPVDIQNNWFDRKDFLL